MDSSLRAAMSTISRLHGFRPLTLLVLGDPRADLCRSLSAMGHDVWCCPDDQRSLHGSHESEIAASLDDIVGSSHQWDAVLAIEGFQRMQGVRTPQALGTALSFLATSAHHVLLEAPRHKLAPDLHDLGPYRLDLLADSFDYLSELPSLGQVSGVQERPLIHASNAGLLLGSAWIPTDSLIPTDERTRSDRRYQRTFTYEESIVKVVAASPDYAERNEAAAEADFLMQASDDLIRGLALPRVDHVHQGRAVTTLIRSAVPGEALHPTTLQDGFQQFEAVIDVACLWAKNKMFHNDLRPWNLLWDGHHMHLIDYADAGVHDLDVQDLPQILCLAATLAALATSEIRWGNFFLEDAVKALEKVVDVGDPRWYTIPWLTLPTWAGDIKKALSQLVQPNAREIITTVLGAMPTHEFTRSRLRPGVS
jgi:hypothetical protein